MKKKLLGYLSHWKESSSEDNTFTISFRSEFSKKPPGKSRGKKDLSCEEIYEGQACELFITAAMLSEAIEAAAKDVSEDPQQFLTRYRHTFPMPVADKEVLAICSLSFSSMYLPYGVRYPSLEARAEIEGEALAALLPDRCAEERALLHASYIAEAERQYDGELEASLGGMKL